MFYETFSTDKLRLTLVAWLITKYLIHSSPPEFKTNVHVCVQKEKSLMLPDLTNVICVKYSISKHNRVSATHKKLKMFLSIK